MHERGYRKPLLMVNKREVWQRGPVENIPPLLQPVAHALLQADEEAQAIMENFPEEHLCERPGGAASPAFHLQHLTGVLDRLFTYARQQTLSNEQLQYLSAEGKQEKKSVDVSALLKTFHGQVNLSLKQLSETDPGTLTDKREIGRQKIPTTLVGLYVHAAEHSMRHIGQLLVTVRLIKSKSLASSQSDGGDPI
jgi:hypothetical protein